MDEGDWQAALSRLDQHDMYGKILKFPSMISDSIRITSEVDMSPREKPNGVVCCGMGGSGAGLDLVKAWLTDEASVPIEVVKDYRLPAFVTADTLVVVVSYSGDTEEAISCMRDAIRRGAKLLSISSGGKIESLCKSYSTPHVNVPPDLAPRSALPYLFIPIVMSLQVNGLISPRRVTEIEKSAMTVQKVLDGIRVEVPVKRNEAKALASVLFGHFPAIYGHGVLGAVGLRFKQQLNENAKMFAAHNVFPELDHNELEAVRFVGNEHVTVVLLRSQFESEVVEHRIEVSKEIFKSKGQTVIEVRAPGDTAISEALSLIVKLDMTSLYLALLNGVDPTCTPNIWTLKERLGLES